MKTTVAILSAACLLVTAGIAASAAPRPAGIETTDFLEPQTEAGPPALSAEARLQRGREKYSLRRFAEAIDDLKAAVDTFVAPPQIQKYVETGHFDSIASLETALVYLALSYSEVGRTAEAREQILRLQEAERIEPVFASLKLSGEAARFEALAAKLLPEIALPANAAQASSRTGIGATQTSAAAPAGTEGDLAAPQPTAIPARATAARTGGVDEHAVEPVGQRALITTLRVGDRYASGGENDESNATSLRALRSPDASRKDLAEAGVGFYRAGDFAHAVEAFNRLGSLVKGEEDLRYYLAVSLYETGHYEGALRELTSALPFIQQTGEVARYRAKIELSAAAAGVLPK